MTFTITRKALLKPLQLIAGIVERRQTKPILANALMVVHDNQLSLSGTDLEVELVGRVSLEGATEDSEFTVPARKLMDICKALPEQAPITFALDNQRVKLTADRSRFTLSSLPAREFPNVKEEPDSLTFTISQSILRHLIERTGFAMAQQDVRYYLNGLLLEVSQGQLRAVATDGHRLALCTASADINLPDKYQAIIPRKGILEMARLLTAGDEPVHIALGAKHIRAKTSSFTFTSKLVDGKFPDYNAVLPKGSDKVVMGDRQLLRQALQRAAVLSNEKYRGIRLILSDHQLKMLANNPEQEEAEDEVAVDYQGSELEIGFNVSYLLDVLSVLSGSTVKITLSDANTSVLLTEATDVSDAVYVIMPMRL